MKVLPVELGDAALARRRSEAQLLASVNHPGLVVLFDAVTDPDATYLVMELLDGGTLRDRVAAGPVPSTVLAGFGAQVAEALAYIHGRGIVHRDVKPANILLTAAPGGQHAAAAKLSDFGIAKLLETAPNGATGILGTARYLSPEQARGLPAGPASDVYSLGLTLLEALTGAPAFPGDAAESLVARLVRDPVVPGSLGYGWRSLLAGMLSRDPATRPTAEQAGAQLRGIAAGAEVDDPTATMPMPSGSAGDAPTVSAITAPLPAALPAARPRRRGRAALVGLVGVVLLGAGALVPTVLQGSAGTRSEPTRSSVPAASSAAPSATASALPSATVQPAVERTAGTPSPSPSTPSSAADGSGASGGSATSSKGSATTSKEKSGSEKVKPAESKGNGKAKSNGKTKSNGKAKSNGK